VRHEIFQSITGALKNVSIMAINKNQALLLGRYKKGFCGARCHNLMYIFESYKNEDEKEAFCR
jgi:hypothetical protein